MPVGNTLSSLMKLMVEPLKRQGRKAWMFFRSKHQLEADLIEVKEQKVADLPQYKM